MKTRVRFAAIVAVLALLIGFITERELTRGLSFDALLTLRHMVLGDRHQGQASDVVVVNIDENTFGAAGFVDQPFALWAPQFATVLDALDTAGATVVGIDLIFATTAEKVKPGHDRPLWASLGRLGAAERVVLADASFGKRYLGPHKYFAALVGYQKNIRSVNVPIGVDGIVRYLPLWQGTGGKETTIPTFSPTLAQRAGFDLEKLPTGMRSMAPNYGDAMVAPVYAFQAIHQCAGAGAQGIESLKAAFAGKTVLLGAAIDVEDRKVTSGRGFVEGGNPQTLPCAAIASEESTPPPQQQSTPISRRTIPGVFIHAQAVNDLLRGEVARFWPIGFGMLAFAMMATAGSVFSIFLRAQTASLLLAGTLLLWIAGTVASASVDWFAPLLGGATAAVAAFLIGLGLRTFVIDRERRRMALALSRYLDVHLAQKLMESDQPPELGGETREVTIWFSDIAGFSTVAETMEPRELVRELNAYIDAGRGDRGRRWHHRPIRRGCGGRDFRRAGAAAQPRRGGDARSSCGAGQAPRRDGQGGGIQDPHRPQHRQLRSRQCRFDQPHQLYRDRRYGERGGAPGSREQGTRHRDPRQRLNGAGGRPRLCLPRPRTDSREGAGGSGGRA
jgi:adenylate cyclase